jgi:hypothetical protein
MAPGAKRARFRLFSMLLHEENVAMTVETNTDHLQRPAAGKWPPQGRGPSETAGRMQQPQAPESFEDELIFPTISPPSVWPRIFPGL